MGAIRILGIDPGTLVVGFGCLDLAAEGPPAATVAPIALRAANVVRAGAVGAVATVAAGVFDLGGRRSSVAERLASLGDQFAALIARLQPHELAIEEAFHGKSAQAALRIGEARGVVLAAAARAGLAIHEYPPARIKRCVTGRGNADKESVAEMVFRQLGAGAGTAMPTDASDALAVALTRVEERRSPLRRGALEHAAEALSDGASRRRGNRRRSGLRGAWPE